jgi:hypothetical protein
VQSRPSEQQRDGGEITVLEYANVVLSVIQDDIRHVHIRVTATLGVAAVFVTQLKFDRLRALPVEFRSLLVAGLTLLVFAAFFFFRYTQLLHWTRLNIVKRLPTVTAEGPGLMESDTEAARAAAGRSDPLTHITDEWRTKFLRRWTREKTWYYAGQAFFATGAAALGAVVARLFLP